MATWRRCCCGGECGTLCCGAGFPWGWPVVPGSCGPTACLYEVRVRVRASGVYAGAENIAPCPGQALKTYSCPFAFDYEDVIQHSAAPGGGGCPAFIGNRSTAGTNGSRVFARWFVPSGALSPLAYPPPNLFGYTGTPVPNARTLHLLIDGGPTSLAGVVAVDAVAGLRASDVPGPGWSVGLTPPPVGFGMSFVHTPGTVTPGSIGGPGFRTAFSAAGWGTSFALAGACGFSHAITVSSCSIEAALFPCCSPDSLGMPCGPGCVEARAAERETASIRAMHAAIRSDGGGYAADAEEAALRMRYGRPCAGCG